MPRVKEHDVRKAVSLPRELAEAIADFRHGNRISSESDAIRQLIEAGLHAKGQTIKPYARKENGTEG